MLHEFRRTFEEAWILTLEEFILSCHIYSLSGCGLYYYAERPGLTGAWNPPGICCRMRDQRRFPCIFSCTMASIRSRLSPDE